MFYLLNINCYSPPLPGVDWARRSGGQQLRLRRKLVSCEVEK